MTGMHALKAEAPAFGNPPMRALEGRLAEHDLDHEKAARHLASAFELSHDREFLADAGQPSAADIERALALCDYECESTKVRAARALARRAERRTRCRRGWLPTALSPRGLPSCLPPSAACLRCPRR